MRSALMLLVLASVLLAAPYARAIELYVGPQALERALVKQLFSEQDGRYYLRGQRNKAGCSLYAEHPQLQFAGNRILLDLHVAGKVGSNFGGGCLGVGWAGDAEVSMLPQAQGSVIGFTDVRVQRISSDRELDRLLQPLLVALVPRSFHVDAASLVSKMLRNAGTRSGGPMELQQMTIPALQVEGDVLHLSVEGSVSIH